MAAKEEAIVLKYLKKNPGSEALDVSFGTDLDESIVKEILQQLLGKQQVAAKTDDRGVSAWTIAEPPKAPPAPKPVKTPKPAEEDRSVPQLSAEEDDSECCGGGCGTGKGFVVFIALVFALISVGASWFVAQTQIKAAKTSFDLQLKTAEDSLGSYRISVNKDLDDLRQQIKKQQAPPPAEEKAAPAKKAKKGKKK
jgi:hypothetical protein